MSDQVGNPKTGFLASRLVCFYVFSYLVIYHDLGLIGIDG